MKKVLLIFISVSSVQVNSMEQGPAKKQKLNTAYKVVLCPNQKLHLAAKEGDIKTMQEALINGADINSKDEDEHTCLTWATTINDIKMSKFLLENGANTEITKSQLAFCFSKKDSDVTFQEENLTPLMIAIQNNYLKLAQLLVKKCKHKKEIMDAIEFAKKYNREKILPILHNQLNLNNYLLETIKDNDLELVEIALKKGANTKYIDQFDNSLTLGLDRETDPKIIKLIIDHDQSIIHDIIDERSIFFNAILFDQHRIDFYDSNYKDETCELLDFLIDKGTDINYPGVCQRTDYSTKISPLMLAALHNRIDIVSLLIWHGADLGFKDVDGHTVLEIIQYISNGFISEKKIVDDKYKTALFAINPRSRKYNGKEFEKMIKLLENAETMKKISREKFTDKITDSTSLLKDLSNIVAQYLI